MALKALLGATILTLSLAACSTTKEDAADPKPTATTAMQTTMASQSGTFSGLNGKHVSGSVSVADGSVVLADFASDEGPDLHLYLTNGTDAAAVAAGKSLGTVDYDKKSQTFSLDGIDAGAYDTVVVHCDKAKAVFGAATLS